VGGVSRPLNSFRSFPCFPSFPRPTLIMQHMNQIYLDSNATTQIDPRVTESVLQTQQELVGNPASQHWAGQQARRVLEESRDIVASLLGARTIGSRADRVIFTSGGTESNNLALCGILAPPPGELIVSAVEHPSVRDTATALADQGWLVRVLPVDSSGIVNRSVLPDLIGPATRLVSVMLANNETGVIQPIADVSEICREADVPLHTDAVQLAGKQRISFQELGVSAMSVSAHKFHGPVGIGALLVRSEMTLNPIQFGGFQQLGTRPGTESVALAVGMARALTLWEEEARERVADMRRRRDKLEALLAAEPSLRVHGQSVERSPQTTNISFPGVDRQEMAMALDRAGVACATGSACASGSSEPSHVLQAMGLPETLVESALRFSASCFSCDVEIEQAASRILLTYRNLRRGSESQKSRSTPRNGLSKTI
jgi:cysteine desulfurase